MGRILIAVFSVTAAWILIRSANPSPKIVPAKEAAERLQQAWADHHTTA